MERLDPPALLAILNSSKKGFSFYTAPQIFEEIKDNKKECYGYITMDAPMLSKLKTRAIKWSPQYGPFLFEKLFKDLPNHIGLAEIDCQTHLIKIVMSKGWMTPELQKASEESYDKFVDKLVHVAFQTVLTDITAETAKESTDMSSGIVSAAPKSEICLHDQDLHPQEAFYGRTTLIETIRTNLLRNHIVVLQGVGGIGKTSLANVYAADYKRQGEYHCTQSVSFAEDTRDAFLHTLIKIDLDGESGEKPNADEKKKYEYVFNIIKALDEHTLLIIDNMDRMPDDIERFDMLCRDTHCHLLITTRMTTLRPSDQLNVDALPDGEKKKLFMKNYHFQVDENEMRLLEELLRVIEGHTLLIELVSKSMNQSGISFDEMIRYLKNSDPKEETELPSVEINRRYGSMDQHICTLFRVNKLSDKHRHVLACLSLMPNEGISKLILLRNILKGQAETLNHLIENGWIQENEGNIRMHPVIRQAVRKEMHPSFESTQVFLLTTAQLANEPPVNSVKSLCGLGETAYELFFKDDDSPLSKEKLECLEAFRKFAEKAYRYKSALRIIKKALGLCTAENCPQSLKEAASHIYAETGNLYKRLADYQSAIVQYQEAVKLDAQNGEYHLRLGEMWRKDSQYSKALKSDERAVQLLKDSPLLQADAENEIGVIWVNQGDANRDVDKDYPEAIHCYAQSERYYREALRVRKQSGALKKDIAYSFHNLGSVHQKRGECEQLFSLKKNGEKSSKGIIGEAEFKQALEQHEKALKLREAPDSGVSVLDIAASQTWIAKDLIGLLRFADAKKYLEKASDTRKAILGIEHPDYLWTLDTYCDWYDAQKMGANAIQMMEQVYSVRTKVLGPSHNYTKQAKERLMELKTKYPDVSI